MGGRAQALHAKEPGLISSTVWSPEIPLGAASISELISHQLIKSTQVSNLLSLELAGTGYLVVT